MSEHPISVLRSHTEEIKGIDCRDAKLVFSWTQDGVVSVWRRDSLEHVFDLNSPSDREIHGIFPIYPVGIVAFGWHFLHIHSLGTGEYLGLYQPVMEDIECALALSDSCNIMAQEREVSYEGGTSGYSFTFIAPTPLDFPAPETLNCFHRIRAPIHSDPKLITVRDDGSILVGFRPSGREHYYGIPSFSSKDCPLPLGCTINESDEASWALIDGTSLTYRKLRADIATADRIIVGDAGEVYGMSFLDDESAKIVDLDGEWEKSFEFDLLDLEGSTFRTVSPGSIIAADREMGFCYLGFKGSKSTRFDRPLVSLLEPYPRAGCVVLQDDSEKWFVFDIRQERVLPLDMETDSYVIFTPAGDHTLLAKKGDAPTPMLINYSADHLDVVDIDEMAGAWGFEYLGNGRLLAVNGKDLFTIDTDSYLSQYR